MTIQVMSQWRPRLAQGKPITDEERHELFCEFAIKQVQITMPWLMPLLNEANATLYFGPRLFMFQTPAHPGQWFEVTQMADHIAMLPWVEAEETAQ